MGLLVYDGEFATLLHGAFVHDGAYLLDGQAFVPQFDGELCFSSIYVTLHLVSLNMFIYHFLSECFNQSVLEYFEIFFDEEF